MWLTSSILYDMFGNIIGAVQSFSPIARFEEKTFHIDSIKKEKEILIKEIHHRVKNNMQLIYSLLNLQMTHGKSDNYGDILSDCMNRIQAMAHVHELLYRHDRLTDIPFDDYIREFATVISN